MTEKFNPESGMRCAEFDARLSEALDGLLPEPQVAAFRSHAASCAECGPLYALASQGMAWLHALPEIEPPRTLVHNILAKTSGAVEAPQARPHSGKDWLSRLRELAGLPAGMLKPQFAMTFAMAFFSLSLMLTALGVRFDDVRMSDLKPASIANTLARQYHMTSAKAVKYYRNLRLVYELETMVRNVRPSEGEQQGSDEPAQEDKKDENNNNKQPEQTPRRDREQNYTRESGTVHLATARPAQMAASLLRSEA